MISIILKSMLASDFGVMIVNCSIVFGIIFIVLYIIHFCIGTKKTVANGGIKGMFPNIIKYLMQKYPNAKVTTDSLMYMTIESEDIANDVAMRFSLKLNPESSTLYITGKIIPGNTKWAWIAPKEFKWDIHKSDKSDTQLYRYAERRLLENIDNDMVFNPE